MWPRRAALGLKVAQEPAERLLVLVMVFPGAEVTDVAGAAQAGGRSERGPTGLTGDDRQDLPDAHSPFRFLREFLPQRAKYAIN